MKNIRSIWKDWQWLKRHKKLFYYFCLLEKILKLKMYMCVCVYFFKFIAKEWSCKILDTTLNPNKCRTQVYAPFLSTCKLCGPRHAMHASGTVNKKCFFKVPYSCCWGASYDHNKNHKGWSNHNTDSTYRNVYGGLPQVPQAHRSGPGIPRYLYQ